MRIALDAMGGDDGPVPNLLGALQALAENPGLEVLLVGDAPTLEPMIAERSDVPDRLKIHPAEGWITMGEKPVDALWKKPNCSISVCWQLMAGRQVDAVVSAGHTGAVVAAGLRTRLFLRGVKRPGIAVTMPTIKGKTVLMDVGANPASRPDHLLQYGIMGTINAREVLGIPQPRVGLMNIGSEEGKGTESVRDANALFAASPFRENYIGNVEGRDLFYGLADVVVCEGFVGNVLLKASEGMADMFLRAAHSELMQTLETEKHLVEKVFANLNRQYQYHESGGAPLLGIDGICIICHGASNERSIFNALRVATTFKARRLNEHIVREIAQDPAA